MTPSGSKRFGAFGVLNSNVTNVGENISKALCKAQQTMLKWDTYPKVGKSPLDRLRRNVAQAMCIDVVFSPRMVKKTLPETKFRKIPKEIWVESPVWLTAPVGAYRKANRISSLLHLIVAGGFLETKKVVKLLTRLSIHIWDMTLGHFFGLCRKIVSVILTSFRSRRPEPMLRIGALSINPIQRWIENSLKPRRQRSILRTYGVSRLPKELGLATELRSQFDWQSAKRTRG